MTVYDEAKNSPYGCYPQILEPGEKARDDAGYAFGADYCALTKEQMKALLAGKQLQLDINGREYVLFLAYEETYKE